jgi:hypothetical protein
MESLSIKDMYLPDGGVMQLGPAGDEAGLRAFTPAFEDLLSLTSRPYSPGQFRWFRATNTADLMAFRRNRGIKEWNERRWAGNRAWSPNVVDFAPASSRHGHG